MTETAVNERSSAAERIEDALRFNPARLYTPAEARRLMLGPDAPDDQMPTEYWLKRQLGRDSFESTVIGRARYLTGDQILQLIQGSARAQYGLPVRRRK